MANNPRKFSEKIALQKQKQAEGTAEFEKIMKEVKTTKGEDSNSQQSQQLMDENVSSPVNSRSSPNTVRGHASGGPIRRPSDRKNDRSPYRQSAFLSPPSDQVWRRTISDSAIHQSSQATQDRRYAPQNHNRKLDGLSVGSTMNNIKNLSNNELHSPSSPLGMGNGIEGTNISGMDNNHIVCGIINPNNCSPIYNKNHDHLLFNPLAISGSLPDLTSVHFSNSINPPLDKQHGQYESISPFSSGNITTSPTMISPTSSTRYQHGSPAHSPNNDSSHYSPTQGNYSQPQQTENLQYQQQQQQHQQQHQQQQHQQQQQPQHHQQQTYTQTHLNDRNPHFVYTNLTNLPQNQGGQVQHHHIIGNNNNHLKSCPSLNISNNSNTIHGGSHGHLASIGITTSENFTKYRGQPSPGSSPGVCSTASLKDVNLGSPAESPVLYTTNEYSKPPNQNRTDYEINFDQFSLLDESLLGQIDNSSVPNDMSHYQHSQQNQSHQHNMYNVSNCGTPDLKNINLFTLNNDTLSPTSRSPQFTPTNVPNANTPTTIPEIVFTDCSSGATDFSRDFSSSSDFNRESLGSLDLGDLDMRLLYDPESTIADSITEDSFRRDLT